MTAIKEKSGKKPAFELVLSRVINAPASRIFEAWSEPKQVAQWFAPDGFTMPVCEMDFCVGGTFSMAMQGFGMNHPFSGTYRVIEPPKHLVWTGEFPDGPRDQIRTEVTFEEQGSKTKLTVRQTFSVVLPADEPKIKGSKQGWTETLNHLAAFTEKT